MNDPNDFVANKPQNLIEAILRYADKRNLPDEYWVKICNDEAIEDGQDTTQWRLDFTLGDIRKQYKELGGI